MGYFNPKPERNIFTDIILKWLVDIAVAVAAAVFLILFLGEKTNVIGNSMADKIKSGQTVLIDKMSYELRDIKRFDVVVYRSDLSEEEYIIKRVIGLPGEEIQIIDSRIYINGEEIEDKYHKGSFESGAASQTIKIGEDEYFVLGDNRNNSSDSRDPVVGNIHRNELIGKAWMRIYPFNQMCIIKHQ